MNTDFKKPNKIRINGTERLAKLALMNEKVFHIDDLATIWSMENRQALRILLARYTQKGILHRIWRGLYSIIDPKNIDPFLLGIKALHQYGYVSCETVLFNEGIINQIPINITLVSNVSKIFSILGHDYRVRKMKDDFLYDNFGVSIKDGIMTANASRAKKDMGYFNNKKYYDADKQSGR